MSYSRENGETKIEDIPVASIVFAEMSAVCDGDGQRIPMPTAVRTHLDEYSEIPYRRGEVRREFAMEGPRVLVGAYKSALLRACVDWLAEHDSLEPMSLAYCIEVCESAAPFDLSGVDKLPYVPNPHQDDDDKPRLPFRPDFERIDELMYDPENPQAWAVCRSFYESLYAVQRFAAGIRCDVYGGSDFVPPPLSWETKDEEFEPKVPELPQPHVLRRVGGSLLQKIRGKG